MLQSDRNSTAHQLSRPGTAALGGFLLATLGVGAAIAAAFVLHRYIPHANLSLVFLTGVLVVAARWGLWPSIYAAVASFLAFNFFFTTPFYTFKVDDDSDIATLFFFLATAALTGQLAARMHDEVAEKQKGIRRIAALNSFAKRMTAAPDTESVVGELGRHLHAALDLPLVILLPDGGGRLEVRGGWPHGGMPPVSLQQLNTAWRVDAPPPACSGLTFLTLGTARGPVGLVAFGKDSLTPREEEQARPLCDQAAIAIERTQLVADLEAARLVSETEQLRSALLSSVSHDLRTPLASIIGSTTTLLEYGRKIDPENQRTLLNNVLGEAERLNRYIQNLLDMTRLGQGGLELRRDWVSVEDIVAAALRRMEAVLADFHVTVEMASPLPLINVHGAFVEQALVNILDNAAKFSPEGGRIAVQVGTEDSQMFIDVVDEGPGVPEKEQEKIFDMFYSIKGSDRRLEGSGLGLAICRGLIGAHGGKMEAAPGPEGRGTRMRILLPLPSREAA